MTETNFIDRPVEGRLYRVGPQSRANHTVWRHSEVRQFGIKRDVLDALLPGDTARLDDGRQLTRLA